LPYLARGDTAPRGRDLDVLVDAFGQLRLVHLRRDDVLGQAVSWARAEQTGHWQDGDRSSALPRFELGQVADPARTIRDWRPSPRQRRQADEVNADWLRRYRAAQQDDGTAGAVPSSAPSRVGTSDGSEVAAHDRAPQ